MDFMRSYNLLYKSYLLKSSATWVTVLLQKLLAGMFTGCASHREQLVKTCFTGCRRFVFTLEQMHPALYINASTTIKAADDVTLKMV